MKTKQQILEEKLRKMVREELGKNSSLLKEGLSDKFVDEINDIVMMFQKRGMSNIEIVNGLKSVIATII